MSVKNMTEDEKVLSRECGDKMEDDAFTKWAFDTSCYIVTQKDAYYAGYAQAERDIMARWPVGEGKYDIYKMGEFAWLRSRLFPNDTKDEVKP